jgi:hypothetical protein
VVRPLGVLACLGALAIAAGTVSDRPRVNPPLTIAGYRVLSADFHIHSSTWSDGALTPWGLVLEAERQGLDAIAITGHNQVSDARVGRWFSRTIGGPVVLVGQEIVSPRYHMIAVGIEKRVSFRQSAAQALEDIHRQGGVGIAAHPLRDYWGGWPTDAMAKLDGGEICHPLIFSYSTSRHDLEDFAARAPIAAIGSSDYHGMGSMGACRTFVYGRDGKVYGDPALVRAAEAGGRLRARLVDNSRGGKLDSVSRVCGITSLWGVALLVFRRR